MAMWLRGRRRIATAKKVLRPHPSVKTGLGTALLVDGDNLPPTMLGPLLRLLEADGPVPERKVFRNWRSTRDAKAWDEASRRHGFERMDRYKATAEKNASDIAVVVSAMDLLHAGFRSFCIASGDTDFAPLIERLRRAGCHIVVIGHKPEGGILAELADLYMPWTELQRQAGGRPADVRALRQATPRGRGVQARAEPAPRAPGRGQVRATRSLAPAARPSTRAQAATRPVALARPGRDARARAPAQGEAALESLLNDAFEVALTDGDVDEDGWAPVDRLGMHLQSLAPGFTPNDYGVGARTPLGNLYSRFPRRFDVRRSRQGRQTRVEVRVQPGTGR